MLVSNSLGAPLSRLRFSISVTVAIGEPNNPTTNSLAFWLTARRQGLAGNGQYCGKAALSSLPGLPVGLPKSPRLGLSGCASQSLRRGVCVWLTALGGRSNVSSAVLVEAERDFYRALTLILIYCFHDDAQGATSPRWLTLDLRNQVGGTTEMLNITPTFPDNFNANFGANAAAAKTAWLAAAQVFTSHFADNI